MGRKASSTVGRVGFSGGFDGWHGGAPLYFSPGICYCKVSVPKEAMAMKPKKLVLLALLTAIALTVFLIEAQIPPIVPIPGVRLGLANIVTVFAVFAIGSKEGAAVLLCRIFLGAVFAGNFSTILYSAAGGFCAIAVTVGMKKLLTTRQLWVAGALGAMAHNIGQMAAAVAISQTPSLVIYLPLLLAIAIVTGSLTGFSAQILLHRGEKLWKTFLP